MRVYSLAVITVVKVQDYRNSLLFGNLNCSCCVIPHSYQGVLCTVVSCDQWENNGRNGSIDLLIKHDS